MQWNDGNVWTLDVSLPSGEGLEFKVNLACCMPTPLELLCAAARRQPQLMLLDQGVIKAVLVSPALAVVLTSHLFVCACSYQAHQ